LRREDDFLAAFQRLGCYLDDLCLVPVIHLDLRDPKRLAERERGVAPLAHARFPVAVRAFEMPGRQPAPSTAASASWSAPWTTEVTPMAAATPILASSLESSAPETTRV
jgi:hypothetical protein